jgi:UBX domain-containing protein 1
MPPRFGRIGEWSNDNDREDDSSDEDDKRESWFAGGERR